MELASLADIQAVRITHDTWRGVFGNVLAALRAALRPKDTTEIEHAYGRKIGPPLSFVHPTQLGLR